VIQDADKSVKIRRCKAPERHLRQFGADLFDLLTWLWYNRPMNKQATHPENQSPQDFRGLLQREFRRRLEANPRYSLRAFARSLGVYHATLSSLLSGQRPFTAKTIREIGGALGLTPKDLELHAARSAPTKTKQVVELQEDEFNLIANWQHDAVLEFLQLANESHEARTMAKRLKMTPADVLVSLQLLERTGMIERLENGGWRILKANSSTLLGENQTSHARRAHQKALLEKSKQALDEVAIALRDHSSIAMTVNTDDLPELKTAIRDFRRKLMAFAQRKNANPDSVYQLQIALFPLTNQETEQ
jgi:transcriptional regulator with XRE-family HTH domain